MNDSKKLVFKVWRHTCLSISRSTGKFKLMENGEKAVDKYNTEIVDWMSTIKDKVH